MSNPLAVNALTNNLEVSSNQSIKTNSYQITSGDEISKSFLKCLTKKIVFLINTLSDDQVTQSEMEYAENLSTTADYNPSALANDPVKLSGSAAYLWAGSVQTNVSQMYNLIASQISWKNEMWSTAGKIISG